MDQGWQKYIESLDKRLEKIESTLESIVRWKWQIYGKTVVIATILGFCVQILVSYFIARGGQ